MANDHKSQSGWAVRCSALVRRQGNKCLICGSRKSVLRIHTDNLGYDETSCSQHMGELERHADETLGAPGVNRWWRYCSSGVMRGMSPNAGTQRPGSQGAEPANPDAQPGSLK